MLNLDEARRRYVGACEALGRFPILNHPDITRFVREDAAWLIDRVMQLEQENALLRSEIVAAEHGREIEDGLD